MPDWIVKPWVLMVAGAALVTALLGAVGWYGRHRYQAGRDDNEAAHVLADLQQFKAEAGRLSGLSNQLAAQIDSLAGLGPTVIKEYHETVVKTPLPADCVIDADRLRSIQSAIGKAAATSQRVPAVPAGTAVR